VKAIFKEYEIISDRSWCRRCDGFAGNLLGRGHEQLTKFRMSLIEAESDLARTGLRALVPILGLRLQARKVELGIACFRVKCPLGCFSVSGRTLLVVAVLDTGERRQSSWPTTSGRNDPQGDRT
jgi:hypothetical protein